jgi:hypothetical protein
VEKPQVQKDNSLFQRIEQRLALGERLSVAEVESAIASDPAAAAAFRSIATELREGRTLTLEDVSARTGFPTLFLQACELARLSGGVIAGLHLNHGQTVH